MSRSEMGIHTKSHWEPEVPAMWQGSGGGRGKRNPGQGSPGAMMAAEGRDAESWLRTTAGREHTRFRSDTKSTGSSGKMDGDDQEVTEDAAES